MGMYDSNGNRSGSHLGAQLLFALVLVLIFLLLNWLGIINLPDPPPAKKPANTQHPSKF